MKRILTIVGTPPEAIKLAPVTIELARSKDAAFRSFGGRGQILIGLQPEIVDFSA